MIKRLLAILFPIVLMPYMIFAISLGTIQNNPSQYEKVLENAAFTISVDPNSIESLRYSPPYYTLKAKYYQISYSQEMIFEFNIVFDYDYNYSLETMSKKIVKDYPYYSEAEKFKLLIQSMFKNSGMTLCINKTHVWTLDGSYIGTSPPDHRIKCNSRSNFYKLGSYIFSKYYDRTFGIITIK